MSHFIPDIMAAIKLLTDEYDRNIVYRQQLKSTFLGFEVSAELNYFMTIAFPCAGGKQVHSITLQDTAVLAERDDKIYD